MIQHRCIDKQQHGPGIEFSYCFLLCLNSLVKMAVLVFYKLKLDLLIKMQIGFKNLTNGPQQPGASSAIFLWSDSKQRVHTTSHSRVHFSYTCHVMNSILKNMTKPYISCRYQSADWRLRPLPDEMTKYSALNSYWISFGWPHFLLPFLIYSALAKYVHQVCLIVTMRFRYAREDTHYLLYIYDLMRLRLVNESSGDDLLLEVIFFFFAH